MMFMKRGGKKLTWFMGGSDGYLEVKVRDDVSPADLERIIQALATISDFFGAHLDKGGSGSGGSGLKRSHHFVDVGLRVAIDQNQDPNGRIVPPGPSIGPDPRIGWRQ